MPVAYKTIPSHDAWLRDSSTALSRRADDRILVQIDEALDFLPLDGQDRLTEQQKQYARNDITCDLFFLLDHWLKVFATTKGMDKRREPAVKELYRCTAEQLCRIFGCTINVLPMQLEKYFGRALTSHGSVIDNVANVARYVDRAERETYRLHFVDALAHRWKDGKLVLADSRDQDVNPTRVGNEFTGYVMSMSRELYMAMHHDGNRGTGHQKNFYHSSYLAGSAVLCAGSIRIDKGKVTGVQTDSGHYQPDASHVVNVLRTLRMHGVDLSQVKVLDYEGKGLQVEADVFVNNDGSWGQILERGRSNVLNLQAVNGKHAELEKTIVRLWKDGLRRGTWRDDEQGAELFVGIFLQMWENPVSGKNTFAGVRPEYVLTAIGCESSGRKQAMDKELLAQWDK